ncbi:hypothetical protein HN51_065363, partial [Arachis hypogaea]
MGRTNPTHRQKQRSGSTQQTLTLSKVTENPSQETTELRRLSVLDVVAVVNALAVAVVAAGGCNVPLLKSSLLRYVSSL